MDEQPRNGAIPPPARRPTANSMRRRSLLAALLTGLMLGAPSLAEAAPIARFKVSPSAPVTGKTVKFDASKSSCDARRCTYTWRDLGHDNSPAKPNWPMGKGRIVRFKFSDAGRKNIELRVRSHRGRASSRRGRVSARKRAVVVKAATTSDTSQATPEASQSPSPAPSGSGLPDASNTGVAGCPALAPRSGMNVTQDGAVIENADISGEVIIGANNVTLRCVRVRSSAVRGVNASDGNGTLLDRVEVDCLSTAGNDGGVTGSDYTLRRVNIHHCEDGAKVGQNVVVEDSWIHDMNTTGAEPHYDGLQIMGCACFPGATLRNVIIRRNNIETRPATATGRSSGATSSIIIQSNFGYIDGVTVESNRLNCGAYTLYSRDAGFGAPRNVQFVNNRIGRCYEFGLRSFDGSPTWLGNVWEDTGALIP